MLQKTINLSGHDASKGRQASSGHPRQRTAKPPAATMCQRTLEKPQRPPDVSKRTLEACSGHRCVQGPMKTPATVAPQRTREASSGHRCTQRTRQTSRGHRCVQRTCHVSISPTDGSKGPAKFPAATDGSKVPGKSPAATDVSKGPTMSTIRDASKCSTKLPAATDAPKDLPKLPAATDVSKSPTKHPAATDASSCFTKTPAATEASKQPVKLLGSVDLIKTPQKQSELPAAFSSKSAVDLTKCSKSVSEIDKTSVKSVSEEPLTKSGVSKPSISTDVIPPILAATTSSSPVKTSNVLAVTTTSSAVPTLSVKAVPSADTLPRKDEQQAKSPMAGNKSPNTNTSISPVSASPPKTSLHSSASFHSPMPAASTADVSSFSTQPLSKSPSVPVTSAGTGKSVGSPSLGGVQSVSSQKCSSGASTISGQHKAQPDSSLGQPLSSTVSQQMTSSAPAIISNIQSSLSSHSQKSNVSPTKSPEAKKPVNTSGTLNKSMQSSSTAGQLVDTKAQPSICTVSKTPDSSLSTSTPSAKSLFTTVSKTPLESQSKVPTTNLQATIPVISSTATVASSKPISSSTTTTTTTGGSAPVPTVTMRTGQVQPNVEHSQPQIQSAKTSSVPPASVTVGNVQQTGTIPIPSPQLTDSSKASSSSDGVINGAGAKTSASVQVQSSETSKKPPKLTTSQPENKPEVMDVDPSPSTKQDSNGNEVSLKDYVVINKNEVPHKDSPEVKESLPKMPLSNPPPTQSVSVVSSSTSSSSSSGTTGLSAPSIDFKDILLNRAFKLNPALFSSTITEKSKQFSVVTYNILADCHFRRNDKTDRYPADEKPFIELPARHKRLMAELCYIDADIVCLQEVEPEYYSKTLSPDMQRLGYEGFYKKRVHENFDEGETTFYKTSRFSDPENTAYSLKQLIDKDIQELSLSEDVKESVRKFMCRPDVLLVTRLRCKNTGKFITVGNVHVNWGQFKLPNLQCVQIARAIREVVNRAGNDSSPHVICGDFNSFPQAPGYQLASEGYLSDSMIHFLQSSKTMEMPDGTKSALIDHLWQGFQHTSSSLKSAYAVVQGREPDLTTMTAHTREFVTIN
ncbi:unnamed protein product [Acanthosepion pharaonis]|uniref:Endonuclease/exonuclease/phosphatase domain-containing protein n=1 Tax=Acanthosepion pharaonis TaxID=158019 RepID=A0A812ASV9_ACAPH|nr:unnamed protein product [Sepia pharaonis]